MNTKKFLTSLAFASVVLISGCSNDDDNIILTSPTVSTTAPTDNTTNVERSADISATFNIEMDASTINNTTFVVKQGTTVVPGEVTSSGKIATFTPTNALAAGTTYDVLITTGAKDIAGNAIAAEKNWSFTTKNASANQQAIVNLKTSVNYVILAKSAINNSPTSDITGDLGLSPSATSFITGFSLTDFTGYATSAQITGNVYAADMVSPTSDNLTTAVEDMILAYTDAAGRPTPDFLDLGTGNLGGKTLTAGLYKFNSSVTLPTNVTISGGANDVWIFQISGDLTMGANVNITLAGGAQAKNIFWQVAGEATFGATSHFEGILLSWTAITFQTGATFKGRALAGTAVILDANTVVGPN
ncbi:ice-binding family protein [Yeosuana sp.]|uniref:ice-binding family protein n=1 Tax=Yeosuana sp. TaxID=2529388 RepID=UPI00405518FF